MHKFSKNWRVTSKFLASDKYHEASSVHKIHKHLVPWYIILLPRWPDAQDLRILYCKYYEVGLSSYLGHCSLWNSLTHIIFPLLITRWVGWDSIVSIVTRYRLDSPWIESRWGRDFPHPSIPALGLTQPPVQWVLGHSRGKAAAAWHWPPAPTSAEVRQYLWAFKACSRVNFTSFLTRWKICECGEYQAWFIMHISCLLHSDYYKYDILKHKKTAFYPHLLFSQPITITKGVQQGYSLSLTLFNIYVYIRLLQNGKKRKKESKFQEGKTLPQFCLQTTKLQWWIQKMHYKFLHINWRQLYLQIGTKNFNKQNKNNGF